MANTNLGAAKAAKNDEFYTQYPDIEREVMAYLDFDPDTFRGKTVLLPCDDPEWSNFTKFFAQKFTALGLRKLISTSYNKDGGQGKVFTLLHGADVNDDGRVDFLDLEWEWLEEDGDFRSAEVRQLLDEADIVVTNPPFSLFREFLAWVMEANKKFLMIGSKNSVTFLEVFHLIRDNKIWSGVTSWSGGMWFELPADAEKFDRIDGQTKMGNAPAIWFTNLDHGRRHEPLELMTAADNLRYNKKIVAIGNYQQYDNYSAIEVPQTKAIPSDYVGSMGVPITFLERYNPEQFEIIGSLNNGAHGDELGAAKTPTEVGGKIIMWNGPVVNRIPKFKRIIIRHRNPA